MNDAMKPAFPFHVRRLMAGGLLMLLGACQAVPDKATLSQKDEITRVEHYLNDTHGLGAHFVQTWPDGGKGDGKLYYDPGRLRLDYTTPAAMKLTAANGHLVFIDPRRDSVTRMSLGHQPLGLLLQQPVHLDGEIVVTSVQHGTNSLQISMARSDSPSQGLLTLGFSDISGTLSLIAIEMTDVERQHIRLDLDDVHAGPAWPDDLFSLSTTK
ncbi:outer membrane lipoprotein carrier protein LolA [Gluconacetobacter entanii]|nr:outer membrane lipoprotein carrier protein LolA [Gluconacetobacter entanii]MCW4584253.1 outer membrane lipoprotein carrier protein LolA [Gluconacetobacter entanii]MCW4587667.1 outer membrane lipoprotein carrier protein LolA [Gluconacetobacter entanii]